MKIWRNEDIESLTLKRIGEYESKLGQIHSPPIPLDLIIEHVFDLRIVWEEIAELPGETIFGGLRPEVSEIILNEKHRQLFGEKPGLERSTKGHELGHWDLFVDPGAIGHPTLTGFEPGPSAAFIRRTTPSGIVEILQKANVDDVAYSVYKQYSSGRDVPDEATAVNRYAAAISMPQYLIQKSVKEFDLTNWPDLYRLAELFDVTISAMTVRLQQLKLLYVAEDRSLHLSKEKALGQQSMF